MITISPGHWHIGTGARDLIDEVTEARNVVNGVVYGLAKRGIKAHVVVDQLSTNQRENLAYLVREHNRTARKLDLSIHFNAVAGRRTEPIGTEVLYRRNDVAKLAHAMSAQISAAGNLRNRGAKKRDNLAWLNSVTARALLLEICFVNSQADVISYKANFRAICESIAELLVNEIVRMND